MLQVTYLTLLDRQAWKILLPCRLENGFVFFLHFPGFCRQFGGGFVNPIRVTKISTPLKKNIRTSFFLKKKTLRSSGPTKWPNHCYFKCQRVFTTPTMIQVDPEKTSMPRCPRCLREQLHCPMPKGTLAATGHGTVSCVQQVAWMWQGGWLHQVDSEVVKISCKKFQRWRKIRTTKNTSHLTTATVHPEIFTRKLHRIKKSHNNTSHQLGCILEPKVTRLRASFSSRSRRPKMQSPCPTRGIFHSTQ